MAETQEFKIFYLGEEDYSKSADVPEQTKKTAESIEKTLKEKVNAKLKLLNDNINNLVKSVDEKISEKAFTTETGNKLELSISNDTYEIEIKLLDKLNNVLSSQKIDLPLETMVVNARYDEDSKSVVLILTNGNEVSFSVADLVSELVSTEYFNKALNGKVDKEEGKGLSTNDFTDEYKNKVDSLESGGSGIAEVSTGRVTLEAETEIINDYEVILPVNYIVGNNSLFLYWNGVKLIKETETEDGQFKEVGEVGSISNKIRFHRTEDDGNYIISDNVTLEVVVIGTVVQEGGI